MRTRPNKSKRFFRKIPLQQKRNILWWYLLQGELKKCLLGFEVVNLQQAVDLFQDALALHRQRTFDFAHGKKFYALKIVETEDAIERGFLCF